MRRPNADHILPSSRPSPRPPALAAASAGGKPDPHARILAMRRDLAAQDGTSAQWTELGQALRALGRNDAARAALQRALRLDAGNLAARMALVRVECGEGYCMEGVRLCWEALADDPGRPALHRALAYALRAAGLDEHAEEVLHQAGLQEPDAQANEEGNLPAAEEAAPDCALLERWRARLAPWSGLKVGLAWTAGPAQALHHSLTLAECAPLAGIPGIVFFGLKRESAAESAHPPEGMELFELSEEMHAPQDLAAAVMQMDLVISTDAVLAGKAAALGRPCWLLCAAGGDAPPAAGALRVFRQQQRGQWDEALQELAAALLERAAAEAAAGRLDAAQARLLEARRLTDGYRMPEAEPLYRALLAQHPLTPQLCGALRRYMERSGRHLIADMLAPRPAADGVELGRTVDLRAFMLSRQNKRDAAFKLWEAVLEEGLPALPTLMRYAEAAHAHRDWERAARVWEKAMELYPLAPQAALGAAFTYAEKNDADKAIACFRRGLAGAAHHAAAHRRLGCLLRDRGDREGALRHMQKAVCLDPGHTQGWEYLGHLLYCAARYQAARYCLEQAVAMRPTHFARVHHGYCAYMLKDYETAISSLDEALRLSPDDRQALNQKAVCLDLLQRHEEAAQALEQLRGRDPEAFDRDELQRKTLFRKHLSLAHAGVARPWPQVHWSGRGFRGQRWQGQPLRDKTLLVYQDGGFGDSIHAARFYQVIRQEYGPARLTLAVWPELTRLLGAASGADEVRSIFSAGIQDTPCDYYVDDYSLFLVLGKAHWACSPGPYLRADPGLAAKWRRVLGRDRNFRVGLVWAGNPAHRNDARRSTTLEDWAPLAAIPGLSVYALQKGPAAAQAFDTSALKPVTVGSDLADFAETAALMTALDLVVSVDSAPAHLAGALGLPVWVMLPSRDEDWRWYGQAEHAHWYAHMRLFRQGALSRAELILRMRDELALLAARCKRGEAGRP